MTAWKTAQRKHLLISWLKLLFGFALLLIGLFVFFYLTLLLALVGLAYALYARYRQQKQTRTQTGRIIDHDT